jgi:hypothetical protein
VRYARDGWSVEAGRLKGREPPKWYLEEPPREIFDDFYLAAFWSLSTCRPMGFSPGPIPWNHIRDYAEYAGLDRENTFAFEAIIRAMDGAYLDRLAEQQEQAARLKSGSPGVKAN